MQHVIARQVFELNLRNSREAFAVQQAVSHAFREHAIPALERLFDQLSTEEEWITIDRIEIRLGRISEAELASSAWLERMLEKLEEALKKMLTEGAAAVEKKPLRVARFEHWLHFLRHGHLPRHIVPAPQEEWRRLILAALGTETRLLEQLARLLRGNAPALRRLVMQHPPQFLQHLVELFTGRNASGLFTVLAETKKAVRAIAALLSTGKPRRKLPSGVGDAFAKVLEALYANDESDAAPGKLDKAAAARSARLLEINYWETIFRQLAQSRSSYSADELLQWVFHAEPLQKILPLLVMAANGKRNPYPELKAFLKRTGDLPPAGSARKQMRGKDTPAPDKKTGIKESATDAAPKVPDLKPGLESDAFPAQPANNEQEGTVIRREKLSEQPSDPASEPHAARPDAMDTVNATETQAWHTPVAGLVLLHPFLNMFFETVGLTENRRFKDDWSRRKAAALLYYLATGDVDAPEYELVLPKLLCAIPLHEPIDRDIELSEEDKFEADDMLKAAIDNWGALGSTSPDGLRGNFLVRDGKLTRTDTGWRLQVEAQSFDILLDRLPWGIHMVKLPWMEDMVLVEWR
jgi:hypothetical protein